jgi:uncharacterized protein YeaO (DUF488 family)
LKRIYERPAREDGYRILVDRLWPRGISMTNADVDLWLKEISPSDALRRWFSHDPRRWPEFKKRYHRELAAKRDLVALVEDRIREGDVTFLYGEADEIHNNAAALRAYLEKRERPAGKDPAIKERAVGR